MVADMTVSAISGYMQKLEGLNAAPQDAGKKRKSRDDGDDGGKPIASSTGGNRNAKGHKKKGDKDKHSKAAGHYRPQVLLDAQRPCPLHSGSHT